MFHENISGIFDTSDTVSPESMTPQTSSPGYLHRGHDVPGVIDTTDTASADTNTGFFVCP
jgi:hypothetical protein